MLFPNLFYEHCVFYKAHLSFILAKGLLANMTVPILQASATHPEVEDMLKWRIDVMMKDLQSSEDIDNTAIVAHQQDLPTPEGWTIADVGDVVIFEVENPELPLLPEDVQLLAGMDDIDDYLPESISSAPSAKYMACLQ